MYIALMLCYFNVCTCNEHIISVSLFNILDFLFISSVGSDLNSIQDKCSSNAHEFKMQY